MKLSIGEITNWNWRKTSRKSWRNFDFVEKLQEFDFDGLFLWQLRLFKFTIDFQFSKFSMLPIDYLYRIDRKFKKNNETLNLIVNVVDFISCRLFFSLILHCLLIPAIVKPVSQIGRWRQWVTVAMVMMVMAMGKVVMGMLMAVTTVVMVVDVPNVFIGMFPSRVIAIVKISIDKWQLSLSPWQLLRSSIHWFDEMATLWNSSKIKD